ncbi:elongation factor G [Stenotrophomonas panacihumi]|uniref:Elongation factor G n=1 Tax=Stenotrophomonas panacihumi TaxID=676599 RepID=A0A0R0ANZ2_9GAMM|nr:elongation factor G [Stenotrophomonas panacihumi]KRG46992.1 elongation factor G [Stenotrophomonas panacihumi]PTN54171.1 elongation factor G [Stenotrophomonas panacihumi]
MSHDTRDIRNVALAGHPGAGKTTLFEALLHAGGALQAAGSIERGTTLSDHDPAERERGHSIDSAIASIDQPGLHLNLIDTPGYPDFRGAALPPLAVVETAMVVVDAARGVQHGTHRFMQRAEGRRLCRMLVVNKIDQEGVDAAALLADLRDSFGPQVLPLNLPAEGGRRVVDCFSADAGDSDAGPVAQWHRAIVDQVVEINETVMEHYLDEGESGLSGTELHEAFEQCLREGHLVPVCFVSARTGMGVAELLRICRELLPSPVEGNPPAFSADGEEVTVTPQADAPVVADVFKIVNDPFVGRIGVFRLYQGTLAKDMPLLVDDARKPVRAAHLYRIQGKDHVAVDKVVPGDIAAIAKVDEVHFDAVLHDRHEQDHLHLAPTQFPQSMFGLAISPASRGQEQKLATALEKLSQEDPAFLVEHQVETHETLVRGLSDLHLRIMLDRLTQRHGVEVTTRVPRIAYRETVGAAAEGHHRHKKQTGGAGQFGEVYLRVSPLPRGGGFEFVDEVKGGTIPGQFMPAVEKGVRQAVGGGAIAGFPIQDVRVVVYDGRHHPVDSKEVAFAAAGRKAFLDAVSRATPQVLEPIVELEVSAPEAQAGDITGGLASKRARIHGTDSRRGEIVIRAQVPLSELEGYAAELKSATAGQGRYTLDFSHYEPVPAGVQQRLVAAHQPGAEED